MGGSHLVAGVALAWAREPLGIPGGFQWDSDFRGDWDRVGGIEYHGCVATRDADRPDHDVSRRPGETLVKRCDSDVRVPQR